MEIKSVGPFAEPPAVFVSYSWCGDEHRAWVSDLARRLRANGVDVHLDLWDVALGHDLNLFMERYAEPSARVLVVLSDDYGPKADGRGSRSSGVGTETTIVSPTVYEDLGGKRVIPVVPASGTVVGNPVVPRYLKGRTWIDFRADYENSYERLLREIHGVPLEVAPPLGPNPFVGKTAAQATAGIRNDPARWQDGRSRGHARLNLNQNSGHFALGNGDSQFNLSLDYPSSAVGRGEEKTVRHCRDGLDKLGLVTAAWSRVESIERLTDVPMSNRFEMTRPGDAVVMLNRQGYWALLVLDDIEYQRGPNGVEPIALVRYVIATDRSADLNLRDLPQK